MRLIGLRRPGYRLSPLRGPLKARHQGPLSLTRWKSDSKIPAKSGPDQSLRPSQSNTNTPTAGSAQEYVPKIAYQRVSYEYPPPPGESPFKPPANSPYKRHLPVLIAAATVVWALYAYKHFIAEGDGEEASLLDPDQFSAYKLTYREDLAEDMAVIELSPRSEATRRALKNKQSQWNGKKLWSVEVKQPEIQVVRKYTPLPMYYMQYRDSSNSPRALLRLLGSGDDEGRLVLLVKKYADGEVSRYLFSLPVGHEVEVRGPYVGYKFPYVPLDATAPRDTVEDLPSRMLPEYPLPEHLPKPDNIAFFAAGTGIAPVLQSLWSKNPPRGNVDVYYSVRDRAHIPFKRFLLFLEKTGRAKFHYFVDNENNFLTNADIPAPIPRAKHVIDPDLEHEIERELKVKAAMEEIRRERADTDTAETTADTPAAVDAIAVPLVTPANGRGSSATPDANPASVAAASGANSANAAANTGANSNSNLNSDLNSTPNGATQPIGPRRKYRSVLEQVADPESPKDTRGPALAVVCGPEGYVSYVAGDRGQLNDRPIKGLLAEAGWDDSNAFRMES